MSKLKCCALSSLSVAACLAAFSLPAAAQNVLFTVDFSGSMNRPLDGRPMIAIAKEVFRNTLNEISPQAKVGLMLYGHRRAKDCRDIELVARIGQYPASSLAGAIDAVPAKGETPIATALMQAADAFSSFKGQKNSLVLITDGKEECNGDPCAAASALVQAGLDVKVHVVGFRLTAEQQRDISCISSLTGGRYFDAQDSSGLNSALASVRQVVMQAPPPPPPPAPVVQVQAKPDRVNLLSQKNGGEVLLSPQPAWQKINDDNLAQLYWFKEGEEVVFGFNGGSAAIFDTFAIYIPTQGTRNPKEIELSVGDDGPTGAFRSLGIVQPVNGRMRDGWQEFKTPETTGKFLKVKLVSSQGNSMELYEMRLFGALTKTQAAAPVVQAQVTPPPAPAPAPAAATPPPPPAPRVNILSQKNGGEVLLSPNDLWQRINDDANNQIYWFKAGEEAVFGFKDGRPATFDGLGIFLPNQDAHNPKEIEVFAGDEEMTGSFRSLGIIKPINARVRDGWQEFKLPATTAKFIKLKLVSADSDGIYLYEVRLFGEVK